MFHICICEGCDVEYLLFCDSVPHGCVWVYRHGNTEKCNVLITTHLRSGKKVIPQWAALWLKCGSDAYAWLDT
jgi:hypothetical protein